jgi:hypothetical protein
MNSEKVKMALIRAYKALREHGMSRTESAVLLGATACGFLAPPIYIASQLDWANHPYQSAGIMAVSVPASIVGGLFGLWVGTGVATGLMMSRNAREQEKNYGKMEDNRREEERANLSGLEK